MSLSRRLWRSREDEGEPLAAEAAPNNSHQIELLSTSCLLPELLESDLRPLARGSLCLSGCQRRAGGEDSERSGERRAGRVRREERERATAQTSRVSELAGYGVWFGCCGA